MKNLAVYRKNRHRKLQQFLTSKNISLFLISNPTNITYLTGIIGLGNEREAFALVTQSESVILVSPLKAQQFIAQKIDNVEVMSPQKKLSDVINKALKTINAKQVYFEAEDLKVAELKRLQAKVDAAFTPLDGTVENLRIIKDDTEIASIKKACQIAARAWQHIRPNIKPGKTERDIAELLISSCKSLGAALHPNFPPIVAAGRNSSVPHHTTSNIVIKENDVVLVDFGCTVNGYCSDMTRTITLGRKKKLMALAQKAVTNAYHLGVQAAKDHCSVRKIDQLTQEALVKHGFQENILHTTGHGIGLDVHEPPSISIYNPKNTSLKPGMVITIEPGVYISGTGGIRHEDTLLVTQHGIDVLTASNKQPYF